MKRVLVTGAAGFIGFEVCKELLKVGFEVIGVDNFDETLNLSEQRRKRISNFRHKSFSFLEVNLLDYNLQDLFQGMEAIFHFAATPGLLPSWTNFPKYVENNVLASYKVAEAVQISPTIKKLVVASTSSVYGEFAVGDEKVPIKPSSPYGISKVSAEQIFQTLLNESGVDLYILRLFSVFGPNQRQDMAWAKVINAILIDKRFSLTAQPNHIRTFTYVGDIAELCTKLLRISGNSGVYNICGGEAINILEGIKIIENLMNKKLEIEYSPARRGDQVKTFGDSTLARSKLGFLPSTDFTTGIQNQIRQSILNLA